jgi:hypothetical protein
MTASVQAWSLDVVDVQFCSALKTTAIGQIGAFPNDGSRPEADIHGTPNVEVSNGRKRFVR